MTYQIVKKDILWGYLSQFFNMASSLLLLPFILYFMTTEDVGLWYVFVSIIGLIQLLEFGFLPTVSRYISYVYSGAQNIELDKVPDYEVDRGINIELLSGIIFSAKKIYGWVSILALLLLTIAGSVYISTLEYSGDRALVYSSWIIYGAAAIVIFYFGYYSSILKGRGDQTKLNKSIVLSKLSNIIITIPLLYAGFGLLAIALGVLMSAIVDRILVRFFVFDKCALETIEAFKIKSDKDYTSVIWCNAKLMGLVQLGNFLTVRSSVLIVSSVIGLEAAATYGFTLQITSVAVIVASMYFGLQLPLMNSAQVSNNITIIKSTFLKSIGISWVLFFIYMFGTITLGVYLVEVLFDSANLLPRPMLIVFLIAAFLEMNHSLCTAYLTTKNTIVFMKPMLITGILIFSFSLCFGSIFGLWGIILSQFFLQLIYNNWKWPLIVFTELKISLKDPLIELRNRL
ncbi:O-unit flippase-like protein [Pseudoalteromonas sp. SG45-1]|uniref:O-unit flippase-like protein n=1 Tax=Pseudoalteromonas sp. SG45-1 TaxID=2760957 RepID=UPI001600F155|nr:O-unit flippase-like protein [Pseudoalteromonas sp. SG45-1]MBB1400984.1 oligosaccharide flippase family protein [Pseudoalteromonas sp. SG45-1]